MWDNIGGKIKFLAKIIAWVGISFSIIVGFVLIGIGVNYRYGGGLFVGIGFGLIFVGSLVSWVVSWFMFGFGELIEKTTEIEKNTRNGSSYNSISTEFLPTHYVKLITETDGLKLRREPLATKEFMTKIPNGTEVQHLDTSGEAVLNNIKAPFFKIMTKDGTCGWCFSGHLESIQNSNENNVEIHYLIIDKSTALKYGSSNNTDTIKILSIGTKVKYISSNNPEWYCIETLEGDKGFCLSSDLKKL